MKIGIVGAGHAGVAAAMTAAKDGAEVHLFSDEKYLPYFRPKIIAVAFGQISENDILMHNNSWYSDNGIKLYLNTKITDIHTDKTILDTKDNSYKFDKIILTTGSKAVFPKFLNNILDTSLGSLLWTMDDALKIKSKINSIKTVAVIGGGVIGIETALRARDIGLEPIIIERNSRLLSRNLTKTTSCYVHDYLKKNNIIILTGCSVEKVTKTNNNVKIVSNLEDISVDFVIPVIGANANISYDCDCKPDSTHRLIADNNLSLHIPGIYSAGDNSQIGDISLPNSVIKASDQGKTAANNAIRNEHFKPDLSPVVLSIKYKNFELHAVGKNNDLNSTENVIEKSNNIYRSLIEQNNEIHGIQMFGTNKEFNVFKKKLQSV